MSRLASSTSLLESAAVSVVRLNGRPRRVGTGHHKRVLVYTAADASVAEVIRLLRDTAESLAKTLPRES